VCGLTGKNSQVPVLYLLNITLSHSTEENKTQVQQKKHVAIQFQSTLPIH